MGSEDRIKLKTIMKNKIILMFLFVLLATPVAASETADYQMFAKALSNSLERFHQITKANSEYDVVLLRDPTQSLIDSEGNVINTSGLHKGLVVQGIIRSGKDKSALIDDQFYAEGDSVGPYKILEIKENGFEALKGAEKVFVPLYNDSSDSENSVTSHPRNFSLLLAFPSDNYRDDASNP
jgi:hypothetical protein